MFNATLSPPTSSAPQPLAVERVTVPYVGDAQAESPARAEGLRRTRGVWLGAAAFLVAVAGTLFVAQPERRAVGQWLLVAAAVLGLLAWGGQHWTTLLPTAYGPLARLDLRRGMRYAGIAVSLLTVLASHQAYLRNPGEFFGTAGWLWLAGMAVLLAACLGWPRAPRRVMLPPRGSAATLARVAPAAKVGSAEELAPSNDRHWPRWEIALFVAIIVVSFTLRLWDLRDFPYAIHQDEINTGRVAMGAYMAPTQMPLFGTLWDAINLPSLWFLIISWSLKVGGVTLASLRLPAALFGAATALPVYGILRMTWGRWAAIAGAAACSFNIASVHFSRTTLNNIVTEFFWAACFFFLLRGLQKRRPLDWALAGIMGGLGEHFYYGTRLLGFLLVAFCLYLLIAHPKQGWRYLGLFAVGAIGYLAAFGPLLTYFTQHPELYFGRGATVATWNRIPTSWDDLAAMWNTLWPPMAQNLLTFSSQGATDSVYFGPMMTPVEAALLVLGVGLLIWRWRHPAAFLMLLSGFGVLVVGGTLVPSAGFIAHWTPAFPTFMVAIGVPVGAWATSGLSMAGVRLGGWPRRLVPVVIVGGLALVGLQSVNFYFNQYYIPRPEFEIKARQARFEAALGPQYIVRGVGPSWQEYDPEYVQYFLKSQDGKQLHDPVNELPLPDVQSRGVAFMFQRDDEQYQAATMALYPGGALNDVTSHDGSHLFYMYILNPALIQTFYGVHLQLTDPSTDNIMWDGSVSQVGALPSIGVTFPVAARWTGQVYIPSQGVYIVSVEGARATLQIDQISGSGGAPSVSAAAQGWHNIDVTATLDGTVTPRLMLSAGQGPGAEVGQWQLWNRVK